MLISNLIVMPRTDSAPQGTHGVFGSARSWFGPNKPPPFTLIDFNVQNLFPIRLTLARDALLPSRVGIRKDVVLLDLIRWVGLMAWQKAGLGE